MKSISYLYFLALCGISSTVSAVIYKHTDIHGRVTYSSTPIKGATRITTDPEEKRREKMLAEKTAAAKRLQSKKTTDSQTTFATQPGSVPTLQNKALPGTLIARSGTGISPQIDPAIQKARDTQRGRILASELNAELALYQKTQKNIASERAKPNPDRSQINTWEDDLRVHENNIAALKKEIQRIK